MSRKHKVFICIGTRADIIKMYPIIVEIKKSKCFDLYICHSGQHKDLADAVIKELDIKIDKSFNIMKPSQSNEYVLSETIKNFSSEIRSVDPEIVLIHGDTTTAVAGALASVYLRKQVLHIEAGLRTYEDIPFPEELHRRIITHCSNWFACPDITSKNNLLSENVDLSRIVVTGNTISDVLFNTVNKNYKFSLNLLNSFSFKDTKTILISMHRNELGSKNLTKICYSIKQISNENPAWVFLWPVHSNPKIHQVIANSFNDNYNNVILLPPLSVRDMHNLLFRCTLVITDSAGLQEEAFLLNKKTILLRRKTERPEFFDKDISRIFEPNCKNITLEISKEIENTSIMHELSIGKRLYLSIDSSQKIVDFLKDILL